MRMTSAISDPEGVTRAACRVDGATRLQSLDAFRGLVILAMLIVNNLGDYETTGYFWKHADWVPESQYRAMANWWGGIASAEKPLTYAFAQFPLLRHCTLADYVMPGFMLIIGIAIPFSAASSRAKGASAAVTWLRVVKRSVLLVVLGWILCYFRDQFAGWLYEGKPLRIALGMDVLQLLGVGYLAARILYELPANARVFIVTTLFLWHWAILRFWYQGPDVPRGTFTAEHNAISYIYSQPWWIWQSLEFGPFSMNWKGLLSVPTAAATMLLGTFIGDWLRREDVEPATKVKHLALAGVLCALAGFVWAFDLPFNKPRWSPAYLVFTSGVGAVILAMLYQIIDIAKIRQWSYPLVVFGSNALAAYFVTILAKVLLLNTPRVDQSHAWSMTATKYGTLLICIAVLMLCTWRLFVWLREGIGPVAWLLVALSTLVAALLLRRFVATDLPLVEASTLTSLTNAIGISLKSALGPWEGGWVFTLSFVLFWWLALDWAHRRKIYWKL